MKQILFKVQQEPECTRCLSRDPCMSYYNYIISSAYSKVPSGSKADSTSFTL